MFQTLHPKKPKPATPANSASASGAARHRDAMARRSRQQFTAVSDIGDIPPIRNPTRRGACERDLHLFLREYFPQTTGLSPFCEEQNRAIGRIQTAALGEGYFLSMFPRAFAKSTISENSVLWVILYGHRRFVPIFGASGAAATGMIDSIKFELSDNELLLEDFPEVCYPVRKLDGRPQRCASQHHGGNLTHIEWRAEKIVLPIIQGSRGGGAVVVANGIDGATRGMKHKLPSGQQLRPDFVIIDDPQTDESARSEVQIQKRLDIIRKNILKLGGHAKKVAVVMNATMIQRDDMVDRLSDRKKFPAWQTERIKMVKQWADAHETLWLDQYAKLRTTFDPLVPEDQDRAKREATAFYVAHRDEMDAGCVVTWPEGPREKDEVSAIQHAYNMRIDDDEDVFQSECQNEPLVPDDQTEGLTRDDILTPNRFTTLAPDRVPIDCVRLVGHVDVQGSTLWWSIVGFDAKYGATLVDCGTWPKIDRGYFTLADIGRTLREVTGADSDSAAIIIAVKECANELFDRQWRQGDGADSAVMSLDRLGVDANWGPFTDEVYKAIRESEHQARMVPTHGQTFGRREKRRFENMKLDGPDRGGFGWRLVRNPAKLTRGVPYMLIDTNRWKTFVSKHFQITPGSTGSFAMNGSPQRTGENYRYSERQSMIADHLLSEKCTVWKTDDGRSVSEWTLKRDGRDNHWLDNVVSCYAMANDLGIREPTAAQPTAAVKPKSFKAAMAAAAEKRGGASRPAGGYAKFRRGPVL